MGLRPVRTTRMSGGLLVRVVMTFPGGRRVQQLHDTRAGIVVEVDEDNDMVALVITDALTVEVDGVAIEGES